MLVAGVCLPAGGKPYSPAMLVENISMLKDYLKKVHSPEFSYVYEYLELLAKVLKGNARYYRVYDINIFEEDKRRRVAIEFDLIERTISKGGEAKHVKQRKMKTMIPRIPRPDRSDKGSEKEDGKEDGDTAQPYLLDFGVDVKAPGKDRRGVECRSLALYVKPAWYTLDKLRIDMINVLSTMWNRLSALLAKSNAAGVDYPEDVAMRVEVQSKKYGNKRFIYKMLRPRVLDELGEGLVLKPVVYTAGFFSSLGALVPLIVARVCTECLEHSSPRMNVKIDVEVNREQESRHIEVYMNLFDYLGFLPSGKSVIYSDILSLPRSKGANDGTIHEYDEYLTLAESLDNLLFQAYRLRRVVEELRGLAGNKEGRARRESENAEKLLKSIIDEMYALYNLAKSVEAMLAGLREGLGKKYGKASVSIEGLDKLEEAINKGLGVLKDTSLASIISEHLLRMNSVKPDETLTILNRFVELAKSEMPSYVAFERDFSQRIAEKVYEAARSTIIEALFSSRENVRLRDALSASGIFRDTGDLLKILCTSLDALEIADRFDRRVWKHICVLMGGVTRPLDSMMPPGSESGDKCSLAAALAAYGISIAYSLRFPSKDKEYSVNMLRSRLRSNIYALLATLYSSSTRRELCDCKKQEVRDSDDAATQLARLVCRCTDIRDINVKSLEKIESLADKLIRELKEMLSGLDSCCKSCDFECILACKAGRAAIADLYDVVRKIWQRLVHDQGCC